MVSRLSLSSSYDLRNACVRLFNEVCLVLSCLVLPVSPLIYAFIFIWFIIIIVIIIIIIIYWNIDDD
jgi:hypothetical protein